MENKYKYAFVDLSVFLYRNTWIVSKDKNPGEYTPGEVIQMTIWSINKLARDFGITFDKLIFLADMWDSEWKGYYTTYLLGGGYKDNRGDIADAQGKKSPIDTYMTKSKYEELKNDPTITEDELKEAYSKLYFNETKQAAKNAIIYELGNFGMPTIRVPGYEADNLAYLSSVMLYDGSEGYHKPSILITKDSDISYCTSPQMDAAKINRGGAAPDIIKYGEMYETIPTDLRNAGVSLYQYKSFLDSLGFGHNAMRRTVKEHVGPSDANQTIQKILQGNYEDVDDVDLFNLQMSTFDLSKYPRLEEAKRLITDIVPTSGKLGSLTEFHKFCDKYGITKISDRYFIEFISRFDPKLYSER